MYKVYIKEDLYRPGNFEIWTPIEGRTYAISYRKEQIPIGISCCLNTLAAYELLGDNAFIGDSKEINESFVFEQFRLKKKPDMKGKYQIINETLVNFTL